MVQCSTDAGVSWLHDHREDYSWSRAGVSRICAEHREGSRVIQSSFRDHFIFENCAAASLLELQMEEFITRVLTDLTNRVGGPMTFRIILQPLMASLLAVRAGLKDAREDRPPYLWTIITDRTQRARLIHDGWRAVARVFVLAIVMDIIYQWIVQRWIYPGEFGSNSVSAASWSSKSAGSSLAASTPDG
jgi:hypothetical protein